jgi:cell division protein FtsB
MAVIGARPATGPWWLGRGLRPRSRVKARPRPGVRRVSAGRIVRSRLDVRGLLVAILAAAGLAFLYLSQSSHVAATGYEIQRLQAELAERVAEQEQLTLEIGRARSPAEVSERAHSQLRLISLDDLDVTFAPASTDTDD